MSAKIPPFERWVLGYITKVSPNNDWHEGFILDMSQDLKDGNWEEAGDIIGTHWDVEADKPIRRGLAYFKVWNSHDDDMPTLTDPFYVFNPPF